MLYRRARGYRRLALLGAMALPMIATAGCTVDQWLIPIAAGIGTYFGWQFLNGA